MSRSTFLRENRILAREIRRLRCTSGICALCARSRRLAQRGTTANPIPKICSAPADKLLASHPRPDRSLEGASQDLDDRRSALVQDGNDVEAARRSRRPMSLEIRFGRAVDAALLLRRHSGRGAAELGPVTTLDLDETQRLSVARHEVDLSHAQMNVAIEDPVAGPLQMSLRQTLPRLTDTALAPVRLRCTAATPWREEPLE